jgi:hypothetical protein
MSTLPAARETARTKAQRVQIILKIIYLRGIFQSFLVVVDRI